MSVDYIDTPDTNIGTRRASLDFIVSDAPKAQIQISTKFPSGLEEVVWRADRFSYYYDQSTVSEDGEVEGNPTTYSIVRKGGWPTTSVTLQIDENNVAHATTHELGGGDAIDAAQLSWSEGQSAAGNLGEKVAAMVTATSTAQTTANTHATRHAAGGADPLDGDGIELNRVQTNYTASSATIAGHLAGIDTAVGSAASAASAAQTTADNHDARHAHGAADALQSATLSYTGGLAAAGNLGTQIDTMVTATTAVQTNVDAGILSANTASSTTYTAVIGDANKLVPCTHASGCAFTIPPNSSVAFTIGHCVYALQKGAAQVTLTAGGGVTFRTPTTAKTEKLYSIIGAVKIATDEWVIFGEYAAT